jgi:outer membrane protein TolC
MKLTLITTMFSAFLIGALQLSALAQEKTAEVSSLTLKQAQEYAIKNNANSRNSAIDMEKAKKKIWETTAIGLPQINAQANYQHLFTVPSLSLGGTTFLTTNLPAGTPITSDDILNKNVSMGFSPSAPIPLGVKNNTTLDITVSQLIFSGQYIVGLQATRVYYTMTDQTRQKTEIDLKESVANTYTMALVFGQTLNVLAKSLENTDKTLADMQQMYKQGMIENTDVDQIELVSLTLKNAVSSMSRQLDATYDLLKYQIGMPFADKIVLADDLESLTGSVNLEAIAGTQFNLNNNLDYQILKTSEAISNLNLKLEKSSYLPDLAAVYRHEEMVNAPEFNFNPKDVFGISMNIPIFSSGMRNVKVQQRKLELQQIINTKNDVANGLQLQFINSRNDLITAYEKYQNDKRNIELTKRIYDKTIIKFKEGIASSREITDNLNQYLTAQSNMYSSIMAVISAKNKLDKLNNKL